MLKVTKKYIKELVKDGLAIDITSYRFEQCKELYHTHCIDVISVSTGIYGLSGALLKDENNQLYAITARNTTLFYFA
jgi:hypothetical protein